LVKHYSASERHEGLDDFVRDKGKGLIGLLAGPPGVGKTLTAETVAEIAHRPLYTMSSGELGESSTTIQRQLMRVFELAERWKAVVLLDEADVFLAERNNTSLSNNTITSIFLRHLEYYQGILLLTTNRLRSLDEAFQSRIHFAFEFDELSDKAREAIWRNFLARANVEFDNEDFSKLAQVKLNGRQIKNIANISHAVAIQNNTKITRESIMLAMRFTKIAWKEGDTSDR
jgi:SpoVK/Ycf46/Vps4 family AAA+-type ATPase